MNAFDFGNLLIILFVCWWWSLPLSARDTLTVSRVFFCVFRFFCLVGRTSHTKDMLLPRPLLVRTFRMHSASGLRIEVCFLSPCRIFLDRLWDANLTSSLYLRSGGAPKIRTRCVYPLIYTRRWWRQRQQAPIRDEESIDENGDKTMPTIESVIDRFSGVVAFKPVSILFSLSVSYRRIQKTWRCLFVA